LIWKRFEPGPGEKRFPNRLTEALRAQLPHPRWMTYESVTLISNLMELNPETRWSALQALDANYFFENPIVKQSKDLSMEFAVTSVHEMDCRRKYEQKMAQHKAPRTEQ
jgi:cyclin-dependent kinase 12/13